MSGGEVSSVLTWRCRDRLLECGSRPLVMGILNVTPDSFSDGNRFFDLERAIARGWEMVKEGADIVDVGGESTRPGADPVRAEEEIRRVQPVVAALCRESEALCSSNTKEHGFLVSIDTMKARVAQCAIAEGAHIINDVSAAGYDEGMAGVARQSGAGMILMHMLGSPRTMQDEPQYDNVVEEVFRYLCSRIEALTAEGLDPETLAVDPGIGFGKSVEHNLLLLRKLGKLRQCNRPVVVGLSRKSFLGKLTGRGAGERLVPSIAAMLFAVEMGAGVVRVHDVRESVDALRVVAALAGAGRK